MEATSYCWRPASHALEAAGFETWLMSARDVMNLLARPRGDGFGDPAVVGELQRRISG